MLSTFGRYVHEHIRIRVWKSVNGDRHLARGEDPRCGRNSPPFAGESLLETKEANRVRFQKGFFYLTRKVIVASVAHHATRQSVAETAQRLGNDMLDAPRKTGISLAEDASHRATNINQTGFIANRLPVSP